MWLLAVAGDSPPCRVQELGVESVTQIPHSRAFWLTWSHVSTVMQGPTPESRFSQVSEFWKLRIWKRSPCAKEGNLMFSRAAPSNKASNEAVNYLQCGQSELRCTVSIKCILDFKDLVWKRVITFYVDYAGEIVIFWSNWVKENILLKSVSCKLLCIEWTRSYWVAQDTIFNNLCKPRWKYKKEYIYNWITLMHSKN